MRMRTTVDLDADLLEKLRVESARRRVSFKDLLNTALRAGLGSSEHRRAKPYTIPVARLGRVREGVNLDHAMRLADTLEMAEVAAEIERRK